MENDSPSARKAPAMAGSLAGENVTILAVGLGTGMEDLCRILGHSRWTMLRASTVSEAKSTLRSGAEVVVVCEADLPDGTWEDVLRDASKLPSCPPVVVMAPHADDQLWMEVLNRGGYNVFGKPFDEQEIFRTLSLAWLRQRERTHPGAARKAV